MANVGICLLEYTYLLQGFCLYFFSGGWEGKRGESKFLLIEKNLI